MQCTVKKASFSADLYRSIMKLPVESTLEVSGAVVRDTRAPGGCELQVRGLKILHQASEDWPIAKKYHGPEFLLDRRHLWVRNENMRAVLRLRARFLELCREWFKKQGYTEVQVPVLITAAVEGGASLFEVNYYSKKAYLTQSWQLYAEALVPSLGKIFTIAPAFRAEKSRTRRHLTEFWQLEAEIPWCSLEDIMSVQEDLLSFTLSGLARDSVDELGRIGRKAGELKEAMPPFPRITYDDALKMLLEKKVSIEWGADLGHIQEKALSQEFDKPFFVTHYPKAAKAFYHKIDPSRASVTLSADLLAPKGYGEITGGGVRIDDLASLIHRLKENGLKLEDYEWYADLRKYGSFPHGGFGLGVERVLAWICGLKHIRDAIAFPRLINRVYP